MPTLVILAAGIGARYGKGIKQLTPIGPQGETLMEYSVRDAVAVGFDRVIFVINRNICSQFDSGVRSRIKTMGVQYEVVYQDIPLYRSIPLGTAQAVMLCRGLIDEPFAVVNADDYYGREAYEKAYTFLCAREKAMQYGTICYSLCDTLSDNGGVTRGICEIDNTGHLAGIRETKNIVRYDNMIVEGGTGQRLKGTEIVSMNFWLLPPSFFAMAEKNFTQYMWSEFDVEQGEWLLPDTIDSMIRNDNINVHILKINARCIGMTYERDTEAVRNYLRKTPPRGYKGSFL